MSRKTYVDKNGKKKGPWSEEEDSKLRAYIERYGHWNWSQIPRFAGVSRCGKSCRLRWMNYLCPNIKHGNITKEEEDLIIKFHGKIGNKWSTIAAKLPGRSDNEIKNYWNTKLRKRDKQDQLYHATPESNRAKDRDNMVKNQNIEMLKEGETVSAVSSSLESSLLTSRSSSSSTWMVESPFSFLSDSESSVLCNDVKAFGDEHVGSFWTDPFVADFDSSSMNEHTSSADLDQAFSHEMITDDDFLWSTIDLYHGYHMQLRK